LRQAVHEIKVACRACGFDGFFVGKQTLALDRRRLDFYIEQIARSIERRGIDARLLEVPRLADTLLDGFDNLDPAFQIWVRTKRQLLNERFTLGLEALLSATVAEGDSN